jgi:hypothetical protein
MNSIVTWIFRKVWSGLWRLEGRLAGQGASQRTLNTVMRLRSRVITAELWVSRNRRKTLAVLVALVLLVTCSGCVIAPPSSVDVGWSHTSHPLRGAPFGPANEEDSLDTLGFRTRWDSGRTFVETGLSYRLRDGGFYGDDFIFESRVGVKLWSR